MAKEKKKKKGEEEPEQDAKGGARDGKKKKKSKKGGLVIFLIMLVLVIGGGVALYFLGFLDPLLPMVGLTPRADRLSFEQRQEQLIELERSLELREEEVARREEDIERKAAQLAELQAELEAIESAPRSFSDTIINTKEDQLEHLQKVSNICDTMEAADAVEILLELESVDEMALVVYFMSEAKAGEVLAALPEMTAARILSLIID